MKKQLLLILMMLLPMMASADDSGTCGDGLTYVFEENTGTMTISKTGEGNGIMTRFQSENDQPWASYRDKIKKLIILEGVVYVWDYSFAECKNLYSVEFANSVRKIRRYSFGNCSSLSSISFPKEQFSLGEGTFYGCTSLSMVDIPSGLMNLPEKAFANCGLTSVFIPSTVESIERPFDGCPLVELKIDENNPIYDSRENCNAVVLTESNSLVYGLSISTIPSTVTSIGASAFSGVYDLKKIYIPKNVTEIFWNAFYGCMELQEIVVDKENVVYDSRENCNAIVITKEDKLYVGCKGSIIPSSIKILDISCFYNAPNLESIIIPSSVEAINEHAFTNCKLRNIITKSINTIINFAFSSNTAQHAILYVPAGLFWNTVYESQWGRFQNIREIATEASELSQEKAYTLMNTDDFNFAVYDVVNNHVTNAESLNNIDEYNPINGWQIINDAGKAYLYNIGMREYASIGSDGSFVLSDSPIPIEIQESENGFKLGNNNKQWGFVINENLRPVEVLTAIDAITVSSSPSEYYSVDRQRVEQPRKGLNIVKMADGKTKKVINN